jgi:hypothetical protein
LSVAPTLAPVQNKPVEVHSGDRLSDLSYDLIDDPEEEEKLDVFEEVF